MIRSQELLVALGVLVLVIGVAALAPVGPPRAVAHQEACVDAATAASTAAGTACWTWADEFDGPVGAPPSPQRWLVETGGLGWGYGTQLQAYTSAPSNVALDGQGRLVLTARQEAGAGGAEYTSARISTCGRFAFLHGRAEARLRLPAGQGLWPAFWTLGAEQPWPEHGEIDIVEGLNDVDRVIFNLHQPRDDGSDWTVLSTSPVAPSGSWADEFHTYAVDWTADSVSWSVDGVVLARRDRGDTPADGRWVLDRAPQILVLNLAVGGWPGSPDTTTQFPASMTVDYVRVATASGSTPPPVDGPCAVPSPEVQP